MALEKAKKHDSPSLVGGVSGAGGVGGGEASSGRGGRARWFF